MNTTVSDGPDGLAVVDKEAGWTSHDVVARSRKLLGTRKIGHSGTLDPDATGLLLLGVGRVTRLLRFLTDLAKCYETEVVFGVETSTLDAGGEVTATHDMSGLTPDKVIAAGSQFVGRIEQIPPMVSARRVGGVRLHELARAGIEVEREARPVTIYDLDIRPTQDPLVYRLAMSCSSGTYVRTLAADIGRALGGGAHLRALRRTSIGRFSASDALALDAITVGGLLTPAVALADYPAIALTEAQAIDIRHGRQAVLEGELEDSRAVRLLDPDGQLVAMARSEGSTFRPLVVLPAPSAG